MLSLNMRLLLLALVVLCGLMIGQGGDCVVAALPGLESAQRSRGTGLILSALRRRSAGELLVEESSPCFSLRENEEQRQFLCRSKFNFNPFGLRFGKRYMYRKNVKRAQTQQFSPLTLFS
uniref:Kisspeptin 2 n=1 Tax=Mola mola TaxID=94237 RepID=A0A3Q3WKS4_MOLML